MNEPTLILDEGGMPILEQCEGVIMPADYSFKCINNYVHCESPQYEDLQHLALGMSSHIEALERKIQRMKELLSDDAFAISFQSLGQYRTALIKELNERIGL